MTDHFAGSVSRRSFVVGVASTGFATAIQAGEVQDPSSDAANVPIRNRPVPATDGKWIWREPSTAFFSDTPTAFHCTFADPLPKNAMLSWRWSIGPATAQAGETVFDVERGATVQLAAQGLKPGLVHETQLDLEITPTVIGGTAKRTVWLCSPDVFHDRQQWLKSLEIHLFDSAGTLATRLKTARVPFQRDLELKALNRLTTGLLIVAENNKVTDDTLAKIAWNLVQRGVSVLWIAPTALELPDPTSDNGATPPREFHLRREEFVTELDKRFSAAPWSDPATIRRWSPACGQSRVVWRTSSSPVGWSWIEGIWPNRARLVVCGLPLVPLWDLDPTPRYLLLKLLERFQADESVDAPNEPPLGHK